MLKDTEVIKISFPYCVTLMNNVSNIITKLFLKLVVMPSLLDKDNELVSGGLLVPTVDPHSLQRVKNPYL